MCFCQLVGKSIVIGLLIQIGGKALVLQVMGCEMAVYFLYKIIRRDFRYWLPLGPSTSIPASMLVRVVQKILSDFTCFLHLRHPLEVS